MLLGLLLLAAVPGGALTDAYDPHNPFARIIAGDVAAVKVMEDDRLIVIMDNHPASPGHVLIIPRKPYRNLLDIDAATLADMMFVAKRIARAQVTALHADGFQLRQNNGAAGGQTVFHAHMHVVPRYAGVPLAGINESDPPADPAALEAIAAKLRAALKR
jgi:histidine triad (HIT) family protein